MKKQYGLVPVVGAVAILAAGLLLSLGEGGRSGAGAQAGQSESSSSSTTSYLRAVWTPLHFKPAIDTATNEQCLACHQEVLKTKVQPVIGAAEVRGDAKICKVSIVGIGMRSHVGVASKMFRTLSEEGINIQMISTSEIKTSVVIDEKYMELAVRALHKAFDLEQAAA